MLLKPLLTEAALPRTDCHLSIISLAWRSSPEEVFVQALAAKTVDEEEALVPVVAEKDASKPLPPSGPTPIPDPNFGVEQDDSGQKIFDIFSAY